MQDSSSKEKIETSGEREEQELEELRRMKSDIDAERENLPSIDWINQQIDMIDALLERGHKLWCTLDTSIRSWNLCKSELDQSLLYNWN